MSGDMVWISRVGEGAASSPTPLQRSDSEHPPRMGFEC
jgi:hypothetical protein